jgi:hypothetical protein
MNKNSKFEQCNLKNSSELMKFTKWEIPLRLTGTERGRVAHSDRSWLHCSLDLFARCGPVGREGRIVGSKIRCRNSEGIILGIAAAAISAPSTAVRQNWRRFRLLIVTRIHPVGPWNGSDLAGQGACASH